MASRRSEAGRRWPGGGTLTLALPAGLIAAAGYGLLREGGTGAGDVMPAAPVAAVSASPAARVTVDAPPAAVASWAPSPARRAGYRALMAEWEAALQRGSGAAELRPVAEELAASLDAQLEHDALAADDALLLKARLLDVLEANAGLRGPAFAAWVMQQPAVQLPIGAPASARVLDFRQREGVLLAAWQSQPAALRRVAALQSQLDDLLVQVLQSEAE